MTLSQLLDIREVTPRDRHSTIFAVFDSLKAGQSFVLINDHHPRPLYFEMCYVRKGLFEWEDLEQGPDIWTVKITHV